MPISPWNSGSAPEPISLICELSQHKEFSRLRRALGGAGDHTNGCKVPEFAGTRNVAIRLNLSKAATHPALPNAAGVASFETFVILARKLPAEP